MKTLEWCLVVRKAPMTTEPGVDPERGELIEAYIRRHEVE
jgi:hypothetical protein